MPFDIEKLRKLHQQRKSISADEYERRLFDIQDDIEEGWETGEFQKKYLTPSEAQVRTCEREGCNHSRYPAPNARNCIFHSQGHDNLAANYRRARGREQ